MDNEKTMEPFIKKHLKAFDEKLHGSLLKNIEERKLLKILTTFKNHSTIY